jgi:hypothetical protein
VHAFDEELVLDVLLDFYALPHWTTAARIDEALQRRATTMQGELRRMVIDGQTETALLVPPYSVLLSRDERRRARRVAWPSMVVPVTRVLRAS